MNFGLISVLAWKVESFNSRMLGITVYGIPYWSKTRPMNPERTILAEVLLR